MKFVIEKLLELVGIERDERRWLSLDEVFNDAVSEIVTWRSVSKVFNRNVSATLPMEHLAMTRVAVEGDASYVVLPLGAPSKPRRGGRLARWAETQVTPFLAGLALWRL